MGFSGGSGGLPAPRDHRHRPLARSGSGHRAGRGGADRAGKSLARHGVMPGRDVHGGAGAIDDNRRAIDEAAALGADCLVLVVGGLPAGSRDISYARQVVTDGIEAVLDHARACGVPLAIEPLHPMYAADRACVNTLGKRLIFVSLSGQIPASAWRLTPITCGGIRIAGGADRAGGADGGDSGASHLRLAGADARPAAGPGDDGRRGDRPEKDSGR
jgi:hypothetical protein